MRGRRCSECLPWSLQWLIILCYFILLLILIAYLYSRTSGDIENESFDAAKPSVTPDTPSLNRSATMADELLDPKRNRATAIKILLVYMQYLGVVLTTQTAFPPDVIPTVSWIANLSGFSFYSLIALDCPPLNWMLAGQLYATLLSTC